MYRVTQFFAEPHLTIILSSECPLSDDVVNLSYCYFENSLLTDIHLTVIFTFITSKHAPTHIRRQLEFMCLTLDRLPFDVLFYIGSHLNVDDVVHLHQTCRQLKQLLDESTFCRRTVETLCSNTGEARLARAGKITYKEALDTIYDRRHALSSALPFSARILGHGDSFLFQQGVLCVLAEDTIRVTDVHSTSNTIQIDISAIMSSPHDAHSTEMSIELLNYSDHVLVLHVTKNSRSSHSRIFAISTDHSKPDNERVVGVFQIQENSKLFVRHTARYLYYGTHTGVGNDGHHKWKIHGLSLDKKNPLPKCERVLLLEDFHGTDIGSTVAFEIHNDYFHAVSNQGTYEVEEVDWTSFYHCVRFPVHNPVPAAVERDAHVYRRQHAEGPIHDSWTNLTLQLDEYTNDTTIVESRREWLRASSRQSRTFYTSPFKASPPPSSTAVSPTTGPLRGLPENDLFVTLLDSSSNANYMCTPPQHSYNRHAEFAKDAVAPQSFILARTKLSAYNYPASTFLDLVEDEACCNDSAAPCLRLRIGSRRVAPIHPPPSPSPSPPAAAASVSHAPHTVTFTDSTQYRHSPIHMWPPPRSKCPCAARLHDILNPSPGSGPRLVTGVLDDRCLVYMVQAGRGYTPQASAPGTVVCVDFSRRMGAEDGGGDGGLRWDWSPGLHRRCATRTCV